MTDTATLPAPLYPAKMVEAGDEIQERMAQLPRPLVFTNGVFDVLHRGHVTYLEQARQLGAALVVAVNSDASVRHLNKGGDRPLNTLEDRMAVLAALACVDLVVPFEDDTPLALIVQTMPDVLVKGGDYSAATTAGAAEVIVHGGSFVAIPFQFQRSTTALVERIRAATPCCTPRVPLPATSSLSVFDMPVDRELDACGLNCPLPILRAKKALGEMEPGQILRVTATDPGSVGDFLSFANQTGNTLLSQGKNGSGMYGFALRRRCDASAQAMN